MNAERRIRRIAEGWFITEPLLFAVWVTHRLVERPGIRALRVGQGRVEYNQGFIDVMPDRLLAELLRIEALRILLKHPYSRRPSLAAYAYLASNITLREHLRHTPLPLPTAREVFGAPDHDRQYYEYYADLLRETAIATTMMLQGEALTESPEGGTPEEALARHLDSARGGETTQLWDEDALVGVEIDERIREAAQTDAWGTIAGCLKVMILAALETRVDYRKMLRQFRTSILSTARELTRMKPSRRYGFEHLGSRYRLSSRLLVAADVSGSISDEELSSAFSVVNRIFRYGIEVIDLVQFDTHIIGPAETLRRPRRGFSVEGRGGTDFAPVLEHIDEHREYDGMIIITDGMAPRPRPPCNRRTRVFWLFNTEQSFRKMRDTVTHVGPASFIKAGFTRH